MHADLKDKAVLVTGASTGIGAAVAVAFAAGGARVAVHYNQSRGHAEGVARKIAEAGGTALLLQGDIADGRTAVKVVDAAAEGLGGLDVLVNNAGSMVQRVRIEDLDDDIFTRVVDVNARSMVMASRAAVRHLRARSGGSIINVTSIAARNGGSVGAALYGAAKGFVSTFTRGLARELATEGIRVNAVSPGVITTPFHERFSTEAQLETARAQIPMGRLGAAGDCVGAFLFLASPAASGYITGQVLEVNGGQLMP